MIILGIVALAAIPQLLRAFISAGPLLNLAYNLYTITEITLICCLLYPKVINPGRKKIFTITTVLVTVFNILAVIWFGLSARFISEAVSVNNLVYTIWILLIILDQYEITDGIRIGSPFFWYLTGILLYAPCTMLVFSLWQYIKIHPDSVMTKLWIIQSIFNITMYGLFTIGIWKDQKTHQAKVIYQRANGK
ncbi:hypothetical protein ACE38W_05415 [Chitinophaga sp. Hz27]|uniref:hypothetical protein n=1 Tax=Chitinophaga sp. Hz27 TaxID=3347169 RepID=UPI0035DD320E